MCKMFSLELFHECLYVALIRYSPVLFKPFYCICCGRCLVVILALALVMFLRNRCLVVILALALEMSLRSRCLVVILVLALKMSSRSRCLVVILVLALKMFELLSPAGRVSSS